MPEQLLHCDYVHASIHQTRSERVPQRVPGHTLNSRLLARQSETPVEVNEGLAGVGIVENEFVPSTERPIIQNLSGVASCPTSRFAFPLHRGCSCAWLSRL